MRDDGELYLNTPKKRKYNENPRKKDEPTAPCGSDCYLINQKDCNGVNWTRLEESIIEKLLFIYGYKSCLIASLMKKKCIYVS